MSRRDDYFESEPLAEQIAERAGTYDAPQVIFEAAVEMLKERDKTIEWQTQAATFGMNCYQDRCEGAWTEATVCQRMEKEKDALARRIERLEAALREMTKMHDFEGDMPKEGPR